MIKQWLNTGSDSYRHLCRGCLDLSIAALCWGTTLFSAQNHLGMPSAAGRSSLYSMHQNPHHLTSEHALSLPCLKGGHRWSPAPHALGVTSTKCCCSSCVRNVPCGVKVFSLDCSHGSQCQWAQPCAGFAFSLNSVRNYCRNPSLVVCCSLPLLWAHYWCRICYRYCSMFIVTECCALILQHPVVMERHPCSPEWWYSKHTFFCILRTWTFLSVKTQTEQ